MLCVRLLVIYVTFFNINILLIDSFLKLCLICERQSKLGHGLILQSHVLACKIYM